MIQLNTSSGQSINDLLHLLETPLDLSNQVLHLVLAEFEFIGDVEILGNFLTIDNFAVAFFEEPVIDFTQFEIFRIPSNFS
jgi:hypothetical protein